MRKYHFLLLYSLLAVSFAGCLSEDSTVTPPDGTEGSSAKAITGQTHPCGDAETAELYLAEYNTSIGKIMYWNDTDNFYVTFSTTGGWQLEESFLYAGQCDKMPVKDNNLNRAEMRNLVKHPMDVNSYTYKLSREEIKDCFCMIAGADVIQRYGNITKAEGTVYAKGDVLHESEVPYRRHCFKSCEEQPVHTSCISAGSFRTWTQERYGGPEFAEVIDYVRNNFETAFPNGLVIGCENTLTLTNPAAVLDFLPSKGSKVATLRATYENPEQMDNLATAEIVTLQLNVGFDLHDIDFSRSEVRFQDLVINTGTFRGWTVKRLLEEANRAVGDCRTNYKLEELTNALVMVNRNFLDPYDAGTFLSCPEGQRPVEEHHR